MSRSGVNKDSGKDPQVEMLDDAVKPNSADDVVIQDRELKERRLVRRIDIRILVFQELLLQHTDISWAHVLNYLDRNNIATARLGDFEKDIGLVGTQYNTIISVFFVGYILTQVPTNMILNKMRPSFVEAPFFLIIEGTIPIPVAFLTYFTLPDYPATTKWLTDEERQLATLRITEEAVEEDDRGEATAWQGLKMSFTDPALYMIWLMQLGLNTAASFTNFFPTIVATLGYNQRNTLLLSAPPYVFAAILGITNSWHSDKHRERWLHIVWPQVFCSVGFIISATTLNVAARYTATFMMMSVYGSFGCILSWVSTTLPRPSTKRAVSYAVVNAGSNLASIYASYFYPKSHGPQYWQANILNVAFAAMCILLATILHFYLRWRNRKLRRAGDEDLQADGVREGSRSRALGERWQCHPAYQYTL
ncbi:hypothetical protein K4K58_004791 [Colletotrichum sp. SAR11_239]|nr:hypothetical protein K4K58_004791 [Colletotrichum sp. SAR11_239]